LLLRLDMMRENETGAGICALAKKES